jgi:phage gpG-like protein
MVPNKSANAAFKKKMADAQANMKQDSAAMKQVAVFLDSWVQRNFASKGGNVGGWVPFTYGGRLTTKRKANGQSIDGHRYINSGAMLMQNTGQLRHSFLPFVRSGVAGIGSDLPYSKSHNDGDGIVQRRLLPKVAEVQVDVKEILDNFILLTVREANA